MLILNQHDCRKILGTIELESGTLLVKLTVPISRNQFFENFGNVGATFKEKGEDADDKVITEARILEFSINL
jgi:hypothetical protein